jgi:hypothetical protein
MYLNIFKRQWCDDRFKTLFESISNKYEIYALTLQHDKIHKPTFHERYITHIIIESANDTMTFEVNDKLTYSDYTYFDMGFDEFEAHNPITKKDIPMQEAIKSEVEATLGIDNNVNQDKKSKITFCLNDYTSTEREKIINFLSNVDGNSPEVYIDVDLSTCSIEQAQHLSNLLICSSITLKDEIVD